MKSIPLDSMSPACRAAAEKALAEPKCICGSMPHFPRCPAFTPKDRTDEKKKPAIRIPKARVPNKTEARFMAFALERWRNCFVHYAPLTFHLPSGCSYTPDVMVRERPSLVLGADDPYHLHFLTFVEVKGPHIHNQRSIHAFKEARAAFPMFRWIFAQFRDGDWALAELAQ